MDELLVTSAGRAIEYMRDNMAEQITIDDLAGAAMFSKFYFTRFFQQLTGISPGRFLSAIRIEKAKELLLTTDDTVTEVSYSVGYSSLGTFSLRFRESVGLSPTAYRGQGGVVDDLPGRARSGAPRTWSAMLKGRTVADSPDVVGDVLVGLFPSRLLHGRPARWTLQPALGPFVLDDVPPGRWHVIANAPADHRQDRAGLPRDPAGLVAVHGPVVVRRGTDLRIPDLHLRPSSVLDPPVLLARIEQSSELVVVRPAEASSE